MEEKVNIKAIIQKLISRWYYFLISLLITVPLAYVYIKFAENIYQVRASILLSGPRKNEMASEKFLKGMELLTSHTEIEDEIGILKSFSLVGSTLQRLDFGVSYFEKTNFKGQEKYGDECPFRIELDSTVNQVVGVPVYVKRTTAKTYSVHAAGKNVGTFNFYTNQSADVLRTFAVDEIQVNDRPIASKN